MENGDITGKMFYKASLHAAEKEAGAPRLCGQGHVRREGGWGQALV